jgi:hypothetical protein
MPYFNVMLSKTDVARLKQLSKEQGMSMARLAAVYIAQGIARDEAAANVELRERLHHLKDETAETVKPDPVDLPHYGPVTKPTDEPELFIDELKSVEPAPGPDIHDDKQWR